MISNQGAMNVGGQRFKLCPICGPKLSIFFMLISAWGIVFLGVLGVFFYVNSTVLFEDISYEKPASEFDEGEVQAKYSSCAVNCWIAAALYAVTLVASFWQNKWNTQPVL